MSQVNREMDNWLVAIWHVNLANCCSCTFLDNKQAALEVNSSSLVAQTIDCVPAEDVPQHRSIIGTLICCIRVRPAARKADEVHCLNNWRIPAQIVCYMHVILCNVMSPLSMSNARLHVASLCSQFLEAEIALRFQTCPHLQSLHHKNINCSLTFWKDPLHALMWIP